jgi:diphthamide synthase (EF-2-diphthine--ammonia ligase)
MKTLVSWSSGKDSAWTVHVLRQQGVELGGLLTTINEAAQRVAMHAVRVDVLQAQAGALGLPLWQIPIPSPCPNDVYERAMRGAVERAVAEGFTRIAFGDLFLEDVQAVSRGPPGRHRLDAVVPAVWRRHVGARARDDCGRRSERASPASTRRCWIVRSPAREFDAALLAELPPDVDPCAERGEFHTCAYGGPMFAHPVADRNGDHRRARRLRVHRSMRYPQRIVLFDGRDDRNSLSPRTRGPGRRRARLYRAAARGAAETESVGVHQRQIRQDSGPPPDLVLAFSDLQADLAAELVRRGASRSLHSTSARSPRFCR